MNKDTSTEKIYTIHVKANPLIEELITLIEVQCDALNRCLKLLQKSLESITDVV